jgi:hypothetical protein
MGVMRPLLHYSKVSLHAGCSSSDICSSAKLNIIGRARHQGCGARSRSH